MDRRKVAEWRRTLIATLAVVLIFAPAYLMFIGGMMSDVEIQHRPPYLIPPRPTLEHYLDTANRIKSYLKNSFFIAAGTTILTLVIATPAAFALAKLKLRMKQPVKLLMAFILMIPGVAVVTPLFLMFHAKLGLLNTYLSVILAVSGFTIPFATLILSAYMRSIPSTLLEVAQIDGASLFRIYWNIVLPIVRPAIVTAAIFAFLGGWGDLIFSIAFLQRRELQPTSVAITTFVTQYGVEWNMLLAASAIYALPPMIVVMVASKKLVAGLLSGALKE